MNFKRKNSPSNWRIKKKKRERKRKEIYSNLKMSVNND